MKYLVLTTRTPRFSATVIPDHYAFLDRLRADGILEFAGPFTDRSGGAYLLRARSLEEARAIAEQDPVYTSKSSEIRVCEWDAK